MGLLKTLLPTVAIAQQGWNGWFTSELTEVLEPTGLKVTGEVPAWLAGSLIRTGSGAYEHGPHKYNHIFDGDAKFNKWHFNASGIFFQTRFADTKIKTETDKKKDIVPHLTLLPVVPPWTTINDPSVMFGPIDAANINIYNTGKHAYANCEQLVTTGFDTDTLETIGWINYTHIKSTATHIKELEEEAATVVGSSSLSDDGSSTVPYMSGAHQNREVDGPATIGWMGDFHMMNPLKKAEMSVHRDVDTPTGITREKLGVTSVDWMPLVHSFPATKKYAVLPQYPVSLDMKKAMSSRAVSKAINWMGATDNTFLHVFDIDPPANASLPLPPIRVFETDPFLAMHQVNAYESVSADGRPLLNFDCIGYDDGFIMTNPYNFGNLELMKDPSCCRNCTGSMKFRHYELDMSPEPAVAANVDGGIPDGKAPAPAPSTKVSMTKWALVMAGPVANKVEMLCEMPRLNDGVHGKDYCFYYAFGFPAGSPTNKDPYLVKANVCKKSNLHAGGGNIDGWAWGLPNQYPSEPVFVPRPGATEEDDGVVLTVVLDGTKGADGLGESSLVILDAKTMTELARAKSPVRIPYDVHGHFFPTANVDAA